MDNFKKLGKDGLEKVWKKVFSLVKLLTGDVDVSGKGTLQEQINKKADSSHSHSAATTSSNGFMSSSDKSKLDGIASGANKTTVDSALSSSSTNPVQNKVVNNALNGKAASDHNHDSTYIKSSGGSVAYGETKYTGAKDETFIDPASGVLCAIKVSGNIAATTIYENGSKLSDKYANAAELNNLINKNSIESSFGHGEVFTQHPSEWLPNKSFGFDVRYVHGVEGGDNTYNPPRYLSDVTDYWWNVLTFGIASRVTQIAFFGYGVGDTEGHVYMRKQHDSNVSGWIKIL